MNNLTLLIPAKKEKESLPQVLNELKSFDYEKFIIVQRDDIETINSIQDYNPKILFQNNKGYGDALIYGINNLKTEYFCIFNADGSFDPKEIPNMLEKIKKENLDFVFGSRYQKNSGSEDDTIITLIGNYVFTFLGKIFFGLKITDILYTFVIGKSNLVKDLNLNQNDFCFCVELPIKASRNKMRLASINSYERSRIAGKKKVNAFRDGLAIFLYMLRLFFKK